MNKTLLDICQHPLANAGELTSVTRTKRSSTYRHVTSLTKAGLVLRMGHSSKLLPESQRCWPTPVGVATAAESLGQSVSRFLQDHPVSKEWWKILAPRVDSIASIYHLAASVADADDCTLTVHFFNDGPYDAVLVMPGDRLIGLVRQGVLLTTSALEYRLETIRRDRTGRPRKWEMNRLSNPRVPHPCTVLVITPSRRERYLVSRHISKAFANLRGSVAFFVGEESKSLVQDQDAELWQVVHGPARTLGGLTSLSKILDQAGRGPAYCSGDDDMTTPCGQLSTDALGPRLQPEDEQLMEMLADWPMIRRRHLLDLRGADGSTLTQQMNRLVSVNDLVEQSGTRLDIQYALAPRGIDRSARGDFASTGIARSILSRKITTDRRGRRVRRGHVISTIEREPEHTDGVYGIVSKLAAEARSHPDYTLEWLLPTHKSRVKAGGRVYIAPDASAGILYRGTTYVQFYLEYERKARYTKGMRKRLGPYQRWFQRIPWPKDQRPLVAPVLFIFPSETIEQRFVTAAFDTECRLPILSSNEETLGEVGFLGPAWRPAWEFRYLSDDHVKGQIPPIAHPLEVRRMALRELTDFRWVLPTGTMVLNDDEQYDSSLIGVERLTLARVNFDDVWDR